MKVVDNFLSPEYCDVILSDSGFFPESMGDDDRIATTLNGYHSEQATCFAPYMFWDGWHKSPANTPRKQIVQQIWQDNLPFPIDELCGFEYWVRTFRPGQYLAPHVDEDTFLYAESKILAGPDIGSIYYGPQNDEPVVGGFLEIYPKVLVNGSLEALEARNMRDKLVGIEERERIAYRPNRLVILDAGHQVHGTIPATSGTRYVLVTNVWHKDRKPLAIDNGSFYYE